MKIFRKLLVFTFLSLALVACGEKGHNNPDTEAALATYQVESPVIVLDGTLSQEAELIDFGSWNLKIVVEGNDAGVIDAIRRSMGVEPAEPDSAVLQLIEVHHDGVISIYDWTALLEINPMVLPGDMVCITYVPGCLGEIKEENIFIFFDPEQH